MSLVNDALKRATEAHNRRAPAPAADLPLRPVEPVTKSKSGVGLVLPATLLTIILAALFSLALSKHSGRTILNPPPMKSEAMGVTVTAKSPAPPESAPAVVVEPAPVAVTPVTPVPPAAPAVAAPSQPPPLKLQAVFYTPPQPSAIISGKSVRVGDSLRGLQVVAIGSSSALLMSNSQTNFLTLE